MKTSDILILGLYALGMSVGQVLFKAVANIAHNATTKSFGLALVTSELFYLAVALYGVLTMVWIWLLTRVPLSRAYPFAVLAFVLTPLLARVFFAEPLDYRYAIGLAFIVTGLLIIVPRVS